MLTLIVAMANNRAIGKDNKMPWHLPNDLKYFKAKTLGHPVIMGSKTYKAIGKALPERNNIVLTTQENWFEEGILIVNTLKEAIKHANKIDKEEVFVIGGGQIYKQAMPLADRLMVTHVDCSVEGDTNFPKISDKIWKKVSEEKHSKDETHKFDYSFCIYERI
jgi:dihydrofolate reductase